MSKAAKESEEAKALRIKTGVAKRSAKDLAFYMKELDKEKADIEAKEKEVAAGSADVEDVNKLREIMAETEAQLPDAKGRLKTAIEDLEMQIEACEDDEEAKATKQYADAKEQLAAAQAVDAA